MISEDPIEIIDALVKITGSFVIGQIGVKYYFDFKTKKQFVEEAKKIRFVDNFEIIESLKWLDKAKKEKKEKEKDLKALKDWYKLQKYDNQIL